MNQDQDHRSAEYTQLLEELSESVAKYASLAFRFYEQGKSDCLSYVTKKKEEGVDRYDLTEIGWIRIRDDRYREKRSEGYHKLIKELNDVAFRTHINIILKIYEQGKKDGLSDDIIRQDIERTDDFVVFR